MCAGMDQVDKNYVKSVVYEMSKDSRFFQNEQRKNAENTKRNDLLSAKLKALSLHELASAQKQADRIAAALEASRDLSRTYIHVDM